MNRELGVISCENGPVREGAEETEELAFSNNESRQLGDMVGKEG